MSLAKCAAVLYNAATRQTPTQALFWKENLNMADNYDEMVVDVVTFEDDEGNEFDMEIVDEFGAQRQEVRCAGRDQRGR